MARNSRGGRPNDYDWELSRGTSLAQAAGTIITFEAFLSDTVETLMRMRGDVTVSLDASGSGAGDVMVGAWGLIRSASGSSDVGVSPLTEGGAAWLAYGVVTLLRDVLVAGDGLIQTLAGKRWDVDSKAMRKLRENESVYMIYETVDVLGAPVSNFSFALRGLTAR